MSRKAQAREAMENLQALKAQQREELDEAVVLNEQRGNKREKWKKTKNPGIDELEQEIHLTGNHVSSSVGEDVFMHWEELLGSRESLKRRVDAIAAVHGWQGRASRKSFLGGIEPAALVASMKADIAALDPMAEALEVADLLVSSAWLGLGRVTRTRTHTHSMDMHIFIL